MPIALTIAGSDPSGGAGIQADLKTFHQFGVYGMSVVTLLTVQNTKGVKDVQLVDPRRIIAQIEAVLEDIPPGAAKTGALGSGEFIRLLAARAKSFPFPLVVDPVMISKHGAALLAMEARKLFIEQLVPCAALITPNLFEAEKLVDFEVKDLSSMERAAKRIGEIGAKAVLVKGGHLEGTEAADVLYTDGKIKVFRSPHIETKNTHGTGCTFSAAITAELAKGNDLVTAIKTAKDFVTRAIQTAPGLGHGFGPINHFVKA
ncbi:MAG: bifunctional hydroxymethylpyrimidine kinase/phosphomethylpyrimidine kinase [Candidatus Omnitrophica bacterium]|nr:bifunctional hydroxymethylpyrimidine kinase/phosphomethylpyrimidine kinase [Candidatus Omnitrophota bacterium]